MSSKHAEDSLEDLPNAIGQPARRALHNAAFSRLEQLTEITEKELSVLHGMGTEALSVLREALNARGLGFALDAATPKPGERRE